MLPSLFILGSFFVLPGLGLSFTKWLPTNDYIKNTVPFSTLADPEKLDQYHGFTPKLAKTLQSSGSDRVGMAISLEDLIKDNKERYPKEHVYVYDVDRYNFDFFHNYIQYLVNAATEEVTMNMPLNFKPLFRLDNKAVDVAEMIPIPIGIIRGAWSVDPDKDVALYWTNPKFKPSTPVSPIFREIASSFGAKFAGSGGPSKAAPRH